MDVFLGEIRLMAFAFPPKGWALCDGQLLPINQNAALFSLLGTRYGGNGQTTFGLPDLRGRVASSMGAGPGLSNYVVGQTAGSETVTLTLANLPAHTHQVYATTAPASAGTAGSQPSSNATLAVASLTANGATVPVNRYAATPNTTMASTVLEATGGSQPHSNVQPFLVMSYCIATTGIFPSRQ